MSTRAGEGEALTIHGAIQNVRDNPNEPDDLTTCPREVTNPNDPTQQGYTGELRLEVTFPNCWDGKGGWPWNGGTSPDLDPAHDWTSWHMRYSWEDVNHNPDHPPRTGDPWDFSEGDFTTAVAECPPGFGAPGGAGFPLPGLKVGVRWPVWNRLGTIDAYLASDDSAMGGMGERLDNGGTAHADFMNGWPSNTGANPWLKKMVYCNIREEDRPNNCYRP